MTTRTADDLAVEHGTLARDGDGWYTAALVACAVQKAGRGRPEKSAARDISEKVSAGRYADTSGLSKDTVLRILTAWERQAEKGMVPSADSLTPADLPRVVGLLPNEAEHPWQRAYQGLSRHEAGDRARRAANTDPGALVAQMSPEQRVAVVREVVKVQPEPLAALTPEQRAAMIRQAVERGGVEEQQAARRAVEQVDDRQASGRAAASESLKRIEQEDRDADRQPGFLRYMAVSGHINKARESIRDAIDLAHGQPFSEEHQQFIAHDIARLRAAVDFLDLAVTGQADIDWDAELAKMGA